MLWQNTSNVHVSHCLADIHILLVAISAFTASSTIPRVQYAHCNRQTVNSPIIFDSRMPYNRFFVSVYTLRSDAQEMIFNDQYVEGLNTVDWDEERRQTLETVFHNSTQGLLCGSGRVSDDTSTVHLILHTNTSTCSTRCCRNHYGHYIQPPYS